MGNAVVVPQVRACTPSLPFRIDDASELLANPPRTCGQGQSHGPGGGIPHRRVDLCVRAVDTLPKEPGSVLGSGASLTGHRATADAAGPEEP
ncbi:hypothetical protein GCM10009767_07600 [Kocuria aegyptia]|uniref:Uncharacterized protein n=1 Tax=Kocuria aegyptia TaxID=330943 RepID=A0ABN2K9C6_9MICC